MKASKWNLLLVEYNYVKRNNGTLSYHLMAVVAVVEPFGLVQSSGQSLTTFIFSRGFEWIVGDLRRPTLHHIRRFRSGGLGVQLRFIRRSILLSIGLMWDRRVGG